MRNIPFGMIRYGKICFSGLSECNFGLSECKFIKIMHATKLFCTKKPEALNFYAIL